MVRPGRVQQTPAAPTGRVLPWAMWVSLATRSCASSLARTPRPKLSPTDAGAAEPPGYRRVPGLRRGGGRPARRWVSVDYYIRLWSGAGGSTCPTACWTRLPPARLPNSPNYRALRTLVRPGPGPSCAGSSAQYPCRPQRGTARGYRAGGGLTDRPLPPWCWAVRRWTCWPLPTSYTRALYTDFDALPPRQQRNMARYLFLDEGGRQLYVDWPAARPLGGGLTAPLRRA